jgi:hypothetical protein
MYPLVVLSRLREQVDLLLSDQTLTAPAKLGTDMVGQVINLDCHHGQRH